MTRYNMILANDIDGGIGFNNQLPWPSHAGDLAWLKEHTKDAILICGRKTFESLPRAMRDGTMNNNKFIIITSQPMYHVETMNVSTLIPSTGSSEIQVRRMMDLVDYIQDTEHKDNPVNVFVFGGASVYNQLINICDSLYITTFQNKYKCDTYINRDLYTQRFPFCGYRDDSNDDVVYEIFFREEIVPTPSTPVKLHL